MINLWRMPVFMESSGKFNYVSTKKKHFMFLKIFQWKQPLGGFMLSPLILSQFCSPLSDCSWCEPVKVKISQKNKYFQKLFWWINAAPKDTPQSHLQSCYGQPVAVMAAWARGGRPVGRPRGRAGTGPGPGRPLLLELLDHAQPRGHSWRHHSSVRHFRGFFCNRWSKMYKKNFWVRMMADEWPTEKLNLKRS